MSLALYRKYRPSTFAEVIGQEHVTTPLSNALESGKVHHAYLFSGPRGCGKTSSARIMARSLNCEKGPTPTPCGECQSCKDLVANGPGSIDVIELDAATHGLVDDARDLRDKAFFAPVSSRYKIYIIDEAHQLGPGAANALLKVVEEPPPHVLFIFATTEPDKLIATIRSRTHHYPFRLVPPGTLGTHLENVCKSEGIKVANGVQALIIPANTEVTCTSASENKNPGITLSKSEMIHKYSQVFRSLGSAIFLCFAISNSVTAPSVTRPNTTPAGVRNSRPSLIKIKEQPQTIPSKIKSKNHDFCFTKLSLKVVT